MQAWKEEEGKPPFQLFEGCPQAFPLFALEPFKKLGLRLKSWRDGVLNYFKHPISDAVPEGLNNKIKVIKRRSYGLRDFEYFRLKVL